MFLLDLTMASFVFHKLAQGSLWASCWGRLGAAARVLRPAGSPLTSLRHPVDPRSSEDGWRIKLGTNSTAHQPPCQIRAVWRSAQRHQGGAHRAGDSRGAECHAALIRSGAGMRSVLKYIGPRLSEDDIASGI